MVMWKQCSADCEEVIEHTYRIKAAQQGYMETIRAYCEIDRYGRLHCISSTQIVFHLRRILATALGIPKSKVRAENRGSAVGLVPSRRQSVRCIRRLLPG